MLDREHHDQADQHAPPPDRRELIDANLSCSDNRQIAHFGRDNAATMGSRTGGLDVTGGDGVIALFPSASRAVAAALDLLDVVGEINRQNAAVLNGAVLFVRTGMHVTDHPLASVPPEQRGKLDSADLDLAGKLQKHCPIGRIAMSQEAYNAISFHRPLFRPTLIEEVRDSPILVLTERLITPQEEALFKGMPPRQKQGMPPIPFPSWDQGPCCIGLEGVGEAQPNGGSRPSERAKKDSNYSIVAMSWWVEGRSGGSRMG
jgi:hypothetical protein